MSILQRCESLVKVAEKCNFTGFDKIKKNVSLAILQKFDKS